MRPRQPLAGVRVERPQGAAGLRPGAAPPPQLTPLPGRDPGLGHIFCNMRSALRLPRDAIARRLATNTSVIEQVFALEILLVRPDGSIATAYLSDALALAPGVTATAIYSIRHADGAVEAVVTPRSWPELTP